MAMLYITTVSVITDLLVSMVFTFNVDVGKLSDYRLLSKVIVAHKLFYEK